MRASIHKLIQKLIFSVLFLSSALVFAQAGTEFWLTIPELTVSHGIVYNKGGIVKHVVISTLSSPSTVTVSLPADPTFKPIVVDVPANTTERINFEEYNDLLEMINYDSVTKQGILIESTDVITAYLESMEVYNPDIFTLKGRHALGTDFYTPFQNYFDNYAFPKEQVQAYSSIDIVATEDNTVVTIVPTQPVAKRGGGSYAAGETITVKLNRGESYSARALGFKAADHLGGTHVTSTKPIAIIVKDDSVLALEGWDLIGDQIVPVNRTGSQYIVMNSGLADRAYGPENRKDYAYIVPTQDGTTIFVDGVKLPRTYNAGENISIGIGVVNPSTVISSDGKPFYCFHTVIAKLEIAGAILPPTDQCSGSNQAGFSYSYGKDKQELYMLVMVRKGAEGGFLMDGSPVSWLDATKFTPVSTYWSAAKIGPLNETTFLTGPHLMSNTKDLFHMGYINTTGSGALYGYFSDFESTDISAIAVKSGSNMATYCSGDAIRLRADGGVKYSWRGFDLTDPTIDRSSYITGPTRYNPTIKNTIPVGKYAFEVTVGNACGGADVKDTVMLELIPRPASKTITADFCESEVGGKCIDGLDLTSLMPQLVGSATDLKAIKWTREVFADMQMLNDFDNERNIAVTSATGTVVSGVDNPKPDKINMSAKVLKYSASGATADVRLGSKAGYPFDFATGDIVTMKIFNDRGTSACDDKTFTLAFFNEGANDTIKVSQILKDCNKWAVLTFDFSSLASDKVYTKALLTHTGGWEAHNHYIDDIEKYVDYRVEEIPDASASTLCNAPTVSVTLENPEGCQIVSTIKAAVKAGDFATNSPLTATVCKDPASTATIGVIDLTASEKNLIGSAGVAAGTKVVKWEGPKFGEVQVLDDFDANRNVGWPVSWETPVKDTINPNKLTTNTSAKVGLYPGGDRTIVFPDRINVAEGFIFGIDVCYLSTVSGGVRQNSDRSVSMVLVDDAGTKYPAKVASYKFQDATDYVWHHYEFDFSAHASLKGIAKAVLSYEKTYNTYSLYIDNLTRKIETYTAEITDPAAAATRDGDIFYATIKNSEGCVVNGKVTVSLKECGPTATDTAIAMCEDVRAGGAVAGLDITQYDAVMQSHIADYTTAWFTDKLLKSPVAAPTSVTAHNGDIFYAKVTNKAGLFDTAALTITVRTLPKITYPAFSAVCAADTSIAINLATPKGGKYSSASTLYDKDTLFDISVAGTYSMRYVYTDTYGCTDSSDQAITVNAIPVIDLTTTKFYYCTVSDVNLELTPETGATYAWYLDGAQLATQTSNVITGALKGNYTVEKTVKGCMASKKDIIVEGYGTPPYFYHGSDTVCEGNSSPSLSIEITGIAPWELSYTDYNGTAQTVTVATSPYSIPFAATSPALYTFTVTAITDKMGCPADIRAESLNYLIRPAASSPWIAKPDTSICVNESAVDLTKYVTVANGVFSGNGVSGNTFVPTTSGDGASKVYYAFEDVNQCSAVDSITMDVHALPVPAFDFVHSLCITADPIALKIVANDSIASGTFTGTGVSADVFSPATAGAGKQNLLYSLTSIHSCISSATTDITVHALPDTKINTNDPVDFCISSGAYTVPVSPAGGTLSGIGITGTDFNPLQAGVGTYKIEYYYKDGFGCEKTNDVSFSVISTEPLETKRFSSVVTKITPIITITALPGADVKWYATETSTAVINTGTSFTHGETAVVEKSYWVTQTLNSCESARTEIKLSIISCGTPAPTIDNPNRTVCIYSPAETFVAQTVTPAAIVRWYDANDQLVFTGTSFTANVTDDAHFYAVQDTGCQSMATDISITFNKPVTPVLGASNDVCSGKGTVTLSELSGKVGIYWFATQPAYPADKTASVGIGTTYVSTETAVGPHTLWAVYPQASCLSPAASVTFNVKPIPDAPVMEATTPTCFGKVPVAVGLASGANTDLHWYSDQGLNNEKPSTAGMPYTPGKSTEDVTVYAAVESNGCLGKTTEVTFKIFGYVPFPVVAVQEICSDAVSMPEITPSNVKPQYTTQWKISGANSWNSTTLILQRASATYIMQFTGEGGCTSGESPFIFTYVNPAVPAVSISPDKLCLGEDRTAKAEVTVAGIVAGIEATYPSGTLSAERKFDLKAETQYQGQYTARSYKMMNSGDKCWSAASAPASLQVLGRNALPTVADVEKCDGEPLFISASPAAIGDQLFLSLKPDRSNPVMYDAAKGGFDVTNSAIVGTKSYYIWAQNICTSENVTATARVNPLPVSPIPTADGPADIADGKIAVCQSKVRIPEVTASLSGATITWTSVLDGTTSQGTGSAVLPAAGLDAGVEYPFTLRTEENVHGCSIEETYTYIVRPLPVPVIVAENGNTVSDTLCSKELYSVFSIQNYDPTSIYSWINPTNAHYEYAGITTDNTSIRLLPDAVGVGALGLRQELNGCADVAEIQIVVVAPAEASARVATDPMGGKAMLYNESTVQFVGTNEVPQHFVWTLEDRRVPQSYKSFMSDSAIVWQIRPGDRTIWLTAYNSGGGYCTDSTRLDFYMPAVTGLFPPSALSPRTNGSRVAEWKPAGYGIDEYEVWVYDQWGNTVWYSNKLENSSPAEGWTARDSNGNIVSGEVFTYRIKARFADGSKWKNEDGKQFGNIFLLK